MFIDFEQMGCSETDYYYYLKKICNRPGVEKVKLGFAVVGCPKVPLQHRQPHQEQTQELLAGGRGKGEADGSRARARGSRGASGVPAALEGRWNGNRGERARGEGECHGASLQCQLLLDV